MANYRVTQGIDYNGKRAEVGDVVSDLPAKAIKWLRESGAIEPADADAIEPEPQNVVVEEPVIEGEAE